MSNSFNQEYIVIMTYFTDIADLNQWITSKTQSGGSEKWLKKDACGIAQEAVNRAETNLVVNRVPVNLPTPKTCFTVFNPYDIKDTMNKFFIAGGVITGIDVLMLIGWTVLLTVMAFSSEDSPYQH